MQLGEIEIYVHEVLKEVSVINNLQEYPLWFYNYYNFTQFCQVALNIYLFNLVT